jgi:hypothetical protein
LSALRRNEKGVQLKQGLANALRTKGLRLLILTWKRVTIGMAVAGSAEFGGIVLASLPRAAAEPKA